MLIMAVDQVSGLPLWPRLAANQSWRPASMSQLESSDTPSEGQAHCSIDKPVVLVVLHVLPAQSAAL